MGIDVRTAARVARYGVARRTTRGWLEMNRFPATGMATTHSLNNYLTDSAPGFAAYSTGTHNNNEQEGVFPAQVTNPFYQPRVENIGGVPASDAGKVDGDRGDRRRRGRDAGSDGRARGNRNKGTGITDQYLEESDAGGTGTSGNGLAVLMGGGRKWFLPAGTAGSGRTAATDYGRCRPDRRRLGAAGLRGRGGGFDARPHRGLRRAGSAMSGSATELAAAMSGAYQRLLGLFHLGNMNVALEQIAKRRGVPVDGAVDFANTFVPPGARTRSKTTASPISPCWTR